MILEEIRKKFKNLGINGFIISNTDRFFNSFLSQADKRTEFVTGFSEDFAILVILEQKSAIFVSGRDIRQARKQVQEKEIEILEIGVNSPVEWIIKNSKKNDVIGYDGWLFDAASVERIESKLAVEKIAFSPCENVIDMVWKKKPAYKYNPIVPYDIKYAGKSYEDKLAIVRKEIKKQKADCLLLTSLDSIAWLFNLRGCDITDNPFFYSYALINNTSVTIYSGYKFILKGVNVKDFKDFEKDLKKIKNAKIMLDKTKTSQIIAGVFKNIINKPDICKKFKAIKNKTELKGMEIANLKDSVVVVKLLAWLDKAGNKKTWSELDIVNKIEELRSGVSEYKGKSFATICGVDENSGIVHYNPTKKTNKALDGKIMLLDTGAHYIEGTTDMTRTISLDKKPTKKQKKTYTLVLKGHLALQRSVLSKTDGAGKLDKAARKYLAKEGLDYPHSTGHGIGCFLCVHEAPPYISKGVKDRLQAGMVFSNEPGCYNDKFGVRIENVVTTVKKKDKLAIENLTMIPYDTNLIDGSLLTATELRQVNSYHKKIVKSLCCWLDEGEKLWLTVACARIKEKDL